MLMWYAATAITMCGKSTLDATSRCKSVGLRNVNQQKVVQALSEAKMPMDVENIRLKTGLKNWESTKSILLELVLQGTILGQKTSRGWIFWAHSHVKQNRRRSE